MFWVELVREDWKTIESKIEMVKSVAVYKKDRRFGEETEKVRSRVGVRSWTILKKQVNLPLEIIHRLC